MLLREEQFGRLARADTAQPDLLAAGVDFCTGRDLLEDRIMQVCGYEPPFDGFQRSCRGIERLHVGAEPFFSSPPVNWNLGICGHLLHYTSIGEPWGKP